jgi:hypothetical protein
VFASHITLFGTIILAADVSAESPEPMMERAASWPGGLIMGRFIPSNGAQNSTAPVVIPGVIIVTTVL